MSSRSLSLLQPPVAPRSPHLQYFGAIEGENRGAHPHTRPITRHDPYHWLRDDKRVNAEVLHYLKAENLYCESKCLQTGISALEKDIYQKLLSHYKEDKIDVPFPYGDWFYYSRHVKGQGYAIHCRRPRHNGTENVHVSQNTDSTETTVEFPFSKETGRPAAPETVLFDVNALAEGHEAFFFAGFAPSPDHSVVAYATDTTGNELYDIRFKKFSTTAEVAPTTLDDVIEGVAAMNAFPVIWDTTGTFVFYLGVDKELRPFRLMMHQLGKPQAEDICLYEETNPEYSLGAVQSSSSVYLFLTSSTKESTNIMLLGLHDVAHAAQAGAASVTALLRPVTNTPDPKHQYDLDHLGSDLWITTNKDNALESKIALLPLANLGSDKSSWIDVFPYDPSVHFEALLTFERYVVVYGRSHGLERLWVIDPIKAKNNAGQGTQFLRSSAVREVPMQEDLYSLSPELNVNFQTPILRYTYTSMVTPKQTIEYNMETGTSIIVHTDDVPLYNKSDNASKRIFFPSHDGVEVPMTLLWKTCHFPEGIETPHHTAPLVLYGYGSYGLSIDPSFDFTRLPYLDRGFVYAIAHVRGGGEMGRAWYELNGKFLTKKNTFYDFVYAAEYLHTQGISAPEKTAIIGRSAGGMLVGASLNLRPDLFGAAVAGVPFVDVLNTMADATIPLTTGEWQEWGNPNELQYCYYMLEYSPYDNIRAQDYPNILVTSGLHDPRVAYWEPAKWVAKLRRFKTNDQLLLLKTDMAAGHFSASNRYKKIQERAFEAAFVIHSIEK